MDRFNDDNRSTYENVDSKKDSEYDRSTEHGDHTEIEQPNPSIATPGIPAEMPAREIR